METGPTPRNGIKSDQAHPPIHPTKYTNSLTVKYIYYSIILLVLLKCKILKKGNEKSVYDFVVRHFLACCSKDARGFETTISIDVNQEKVLILEKMGKKKIKKVISNSFLRLA